MRIEITSTLTQEDENRLAPAVLKALSGLLDMLPIAYMIRIDTSDSQVYQHSGPDRGHVSAEPAPTNAAALSTPE